MQEKQQTRPALVAILLALLVISIIAALMITDIPAPQQPVEKELDAKTFLEPKPQ